LAWQQEVDRKIILQIGWGDTAGGVLIFFLFRYLLAPNSITSDPDNYRDRNFSNLSSYISNQNPIFAHARKNPHS